MLTDERERMAFPLYIRIITATNIAYSKAGGNGEPTATRVLALTRRAAYDD
jgi:hypothetical protein